MRPCSLLRRGAARIALALTLVWAPPGPGNGAALEDTPPAAAAEPAGPAGAALDPSAPATTTRAEDGPAPAVPVSALTAPSPATAAPAPAPAAVAAPLTASLGPGPLPGGEVGAPGLVRPSPPELAPRRLASERPARAGPRPGFAIEEENDAFGLARTDDFYTQGLRISSRWASRSRLFPDGHLLLGLAAGQKIYTPSDIRTSDLQTLRHDRPYAGWLYGALLWDLFLDAAPFTLRGGPGGAASEVHAQLAVGTTGPRSLAGVTQTSFHRLSRDLNGSATSPPDPAGWSVYQTANRVTADLSVRYQFAAVQANGWLGSFTAATGSVLALRLSPRACLDGGTTFDGASLGLEVRSGLMATTGPHAPARFPLELWAFARSDGHWVAYDGLIEGPLVGGVTTLVSASRWVGDLDVGVTARLGGLELEYAQLWRTREITPLPPGSRRIHDVGRFRVALLY